MSVEAIDARLYSLTPEEVCRMVRDADIVGLSAENLEARVTKEIATLVKAHGPDEDRRGRRTLRALPGARGARGVPRRRLGVRRRVRPRLPEAVRRFADGESFDGILGMHYREDGEILRPLGVDTVPDLDALPLPAWDLVDFEAYGEAQSFNVWRKEAALREPLHVARLPVQMRSTATTSSAKKFAGARPSTCSRRSSSWSTSTASRSSRSSTTSSTSTSRA